MLLKYEHRDVTIKDFILLVVFFFIVSISLPVSTMGHQNAFDYFFSQKDIQIVEVNDDCLAVNRPCLVKLSDTISMTINMPVNVSSEASFNISAEFSEKRVDGVNVLFKGVAHSHSLRRLNMNKVNSHHFNLQGQLGYCGSGEMQWAAIFDIYSDQTIYKIKLPFTSIDPKPNSKESFEWRSKSV